MKTKLTLLAFAALVSHAAAADFYITGSTAFRTAAIKAICGSYSPTGFTAGYVTGGGSLTGAGQSVFKGTFATVPGTTTIYCSWSGSVEGIRDIANNQTVPFLSTVPTTAATTSATGGGEIGTATAPHVPDFAFSDVFKSSTPYNSANLFPNNSNVGVVAFAWVANVGAPATLTNINTQTARALFIQGFQPLSLFSGLEADAGKGVFLTGRNDGSGTRTTFLAEGGFPIARTLKQYKSTIVGTAVTKLTSWPLADGGNASSIWNLDTAGNGGYSSGSGLTAVMKATSPSVTIYEPDGITEAIPAAPVSIIGYQSTKDAKDSFDGGARLLSYNGVGVTFTGSDISPETRNAIINGQYTLWGYQHLYSRTPVNYDTPVTGLDVLYKSIRDGCTAANLGISGIPIRDMMVSRTTDGGTVAP